MTFKEKLDRIRQQMKFHGVSAYIIPSADPHMSEYLPDHYQCLHYVSGFTGSAGTIVITDDFAGLWTDFRYFEQAGAQLENSGYQLVKLKTQHVPEYLDWLYDVLDENVLIAFDDKLISVWLGELIEKRLGEKNVSVISYDFITEVWPNRPMLPLSPASIIDEQFAGSSIRHKLTTVRQAMQAIGAKYHLISSLDDIAWLFNIRGTDVSYNPVVLSFALISLNTAVLYIDKDKLPAWVEGAFDKAGVEISPYKDIEKALPALPANADILIDLKRNSFGLYKLIPSGVKKIHGVNPSTSLKAIKNQTEIANMRSAMIKDGVALTRFFKWMEANLGEVKITELSAAQKLQNLREEQDGFAGISFKTICGYKAHGALPHYSATSKTDSEIFNDGLLLIDSGGQYLYGTTDITRVIPLGNNTGQERADYTLVLKALIEGSKTLFPKGTCGYQIDAICRRPLWEHAINYGHGTGHGVGFYLNVHEGPQVFNPSNISIPIEPGMITSIEPGVYRPGKHGIRIENLVLAITKQINEFNEFYAFETLSLAYIDTSLVNVKLLEKTHITWLNNYNQHVLTQLGPFLEDEDRAWLKLKCKSI